MFLKGGAVHSRLGPPTMIIDRDSAPQRSSQSNLTEAIEVSSSELLSFVPSRLQQLTGTLPGGKGESAKIIRCLGVLSVTFAFNIAYLDVSLHHMMLNWASFYQPVCPHNTWDRNNQLSLSGFFTQPSVPRTFGGWRSLNLCGH